MDGQDWEPVRVRSSANRNNPSSKIIKAPHPLRVETMEIGKMKELAPESRNEIVQKRVAMKLTQVQLNQQCQFPIHTIRDIEAGKTCPNTSQLNTLNRILKSGLKYAV
jgi:ribosome-binding protein aMBF1 (putative translation factor)